MLSKEGGLLPTTYAFLSVAGICFIASTLASVSAFDKSAEVLGVLLKTQDEEDATMASKTEEVLKRLATVQRAGFEFGLLLLGVAAFAQVAFR
jgi:hypothetical protein